jgi:hypothetical protein
MGITFTMMRADGSKAPGEVVPETACMCAQLCPSWEMYLEGTDRAELRAHADAACAHCEGSGVCPAWEMGLALHFSQATACPLLALLSQSEVVGELSLPLARRAVMGARARFARVAPQILSVDVSGWAAFAGGAVVLDVCSVTEEELAERLDGFADLIEDGARAGAIKVVWS